MNTEVVNGRRIPTHAIRAAHRKANESGIDHAVMFLTGDVGGSDGKFGDWFAVPDLDSVTLCGQPIEITEEMWLAAPYVAIPGEVEA